MEHKIITLPAAHFRKIAREKLKENWLRVMAACLIYTIIMSAMSIVIFLMTQAGRSNVGMLGSLYYLLVYGPAGLGFASYILKFSRGEKPEALEVFSGFERFLPAFFLGFLILLFSALWSLLFLIPGVIAMYRYSMAFYIMHDCPEFEAGRCLDESKKLMIGNKMKLFMLHLSFLGWILAALIAGAVIGGLMGLVFPAFLSESVLYVLSAVVGIVIGTGVVAYMQMATAAFYEELTGKTEQKQNFETFC